MSATDPDEFRRVPRYLRGHSGEVVDQVGTRPRPVGLGEGPPGEPEPVFTVRFDGVVVFGDTGKGVTLHADLWASDLDAADGE